MLSIASVHSKFRTMIYNLKRLEKKKKKKKKIGTV